MEDSHTSKDVVKVTMLCSILQGAPSIQLKCVDSILKLFCSIWLSRSCAFNVNILDTTGIKAGEVAMGPLRP